MPPRASRTAAPARNARSPHARAATRVLAVPQRQLLQLEDAVGGHRGRRGRAGLPAARRRSPLAGTSFRPERGGGFSFRSENGGDVGDEGTRVFFFFSSAPAARAAAHAPQVYVGNLGPDANEAMLREIAGRCGPLVRVDVKVCRWFPSRPRARGTQRCASVARARPLVPLPSRARACACAHGDGARACSNRSKACATRSWFVAPRAHSWLCVVPRGCLCGRGAPALSRSALAYGLSLSRVRSLGVRSCVALTGARALFRRSLRTRVLRRRRCGRWTGAGGHVRE